MNIEKGLEEGFFVRSGWMKFGEEFFENIGIFDSKGDERGFAGIGWRTDEDFVRARQIFNIAALEDTVFILDKFAVGGGGELDAGELFEVAAETLAKIIFHVAGGFHLMRLDNVA